MGRQAGGRPPGARPSGRGEAPAVAAVRAALAHHASPESGSCAVVAFSGGLDSTVLLHAARQCLAPDRVLALHVHHGLQRQADDWVRHCEAVATAWGAVFRVVRLEGRPGRGESLEEWARHGRYQALRAAAEAACASAVLTAHHADDQVETVLMRLARGTGLEGAAAMAPRSQLGAVPLLRPFLALTRDELAAYARACGLRWIEDPSNADTRRLRNAIRQEVLPALDRVLPGFRRNLLRSAGRLRDAADSLAELAAADLAAVTITDAAPDFPGEVVGKAPDSASEVAGETPDSGHAVAGELPLGRSLSRSRWLALPPARRNEVLRAWLACHGCRAPSSTRLAEMARQLAQARADANVAVVHEGFRVRRYRDSILLEACEPGEAHTSRKPQPTTEAGARAYRSEHVFHWAGQPLAEGRTATWAVAVPGLGGAVQIEPVLDPGAPGLPAALLRGPGLSLKPRRGGERMRTVPHGPSRTLKNLFQERGVPAWRRDGLPVLKAGDQVLWVAALGPNAECLVTEGERVVLHWRPTQAAASSPEGEPREPVR